MTKPGTGSTTTRLQFETVIIDLSCVDIRYARESILSKPDPKVVTYSFPPSAICAKQRPPLLLTCRLV